MTDDHQPERIDPGLAAKAFAAADRHAGSAPDDRPPRPDDPDVAEHRRMLRGEAWARIVPEVYGDPREADITGSGQPPDVIEALLGWANDPVRNLVLLGPVGVGKTHLAWSALRRPFGNGRSVMAMPMVDLLDGLRPSATQPIDLDRVRDVDLLLLDDVGAERPSDWTDERTYALIHHRWEHRRPMVVTANLLPPGLREALGDRSYSRLVHEAVVVVFQGVDRRRPGATS